MVEFVIRIYNNVHDNDDNGDDNDDNDSLLHFKLMPGIMSRTCCFYLCLHRCVTSFASIIQHLNSRD